MIDRIFFAALTFCLLIAGTLAVGSAMLGVDARSLALKAQTTAPRVVQLQHVVVVGQRPASTTEVAHLQDRGPDSARAQ